MSRLRGLRLQPAGWGGQTVLLVDVNETCLLPSLDLGIGINIGSMGVCSSSRMNGSGLSYQKRPGD
jgi:hypothetical protein